LVDPPPVALLVRSAAGGVGHAELGNSRTGDAVAGAGKKGGGYVHKINSSNISLLMWRDYL